MSIFHFSKIFPIKSLNRNFKVNKEKFHLSFTFTNDLYISYVIIIIIIDNKNFISGFIKESFSFYKIHYRYFQPKFIEKSKQHISTKSFYPYNNTTYNFSNFNLQKYEKKSQTILQEKLHQALLHILYPIFNNLQYLFLFLILQKILNTIIVN